MDLPVMARFAVLYLMCWFGGHVYPWNRYQRHKYVESDK